MKRQVSPLLALLIIAAALGAVAYFFMSRTQYDTGQTPGRRVVAPKAK
jgi:preprotein translocase subunit YajC